MWTQGIPDNAWDHQLFARGGHFLQSSHWAAFQQALGRKVFYAQDDDWMCMAYIEKGQMGDRVYAPYGPFVLHTTGFEKALQALGELAKQQGATYVRIDPTGHLAPQDLVAFPLHPAPKRINVQPQYTWIKDLTLDEREILSEMASSNRNLYNTAEKRGLSFRTSDDPQDINLFLPLIHQVSQNTGIVPHPDSYFATMAQVLMPRGVCKIYTTYFEGEAIAASLTYDTPTTRYYPHAATATAARRLRPGNAMIVRMMLDAKAAGQKEFDFYGIAPPDQPNHRWAGFTQFKQSFGGFTRAYLGTWEMPVKKLHYNAYRFAHTLKGLR